ncbi:ABC transporter substrate-binding protein [Phycobacter azelaicus]|uniref:ABC transporter substrate-binding protein n=1 Tax=Phycobacter azelaicus TaxID=2668075 RepID=UPI001868A65F|nr:ABC transporter substrate-binding protein [Phycobacter azelaicus]MBE1296777.1 ABC transporter substrate-binding protein [Paracoccaceae bacterium]
MTPFNRRQAIGLLGAAAATGLAAPAIAKNSKAVVGALSLTSHSGSFIAVERNYFAEAGLDVELKFFQAAQPMAVAIASGDVDFGVTAISGGLLSLAQKGAVKVIGGALSEEAGIDGQKILASDAAFQAGLTSPEALGGKRFGMTTAGSSFHYMGSKIAAAHGVEDLKFVPLQKVGAIIGALKSGQIDAWSIVPHIAKALAGSGAVHIIGDVADYLPDYQVTTVFTSAQNASSDRALVETFLSGFTRGVSDFNATMVEKSQGDAAIDEMVQLIHKYVYTDRPLEKAAPSIINGAMRINKGAAINVASVRDQLEWMQSAGLVDSAITLDTFLDTSYVDTIGA